MHCVDFSSAFKERHQIAQCTLYKCMSKIATQLFVMPAGQRLSLDREFSSAAISQSPNSFHKSQNVRCTRFVSTSCLYICHRMTSVCRPTRSRIGQGSELLCVEMFKLTEQVSSTTQFDLTRVVHASLHEMFLTTSCSHCTA